MFGFFYTLFSGGVLGAKKIRNTAENNKARNTAIKERRDTYWTPHNGKRLTKNGRPVCEVYNEKHELVIKDLYNGKVYKNYTEEKMQQRTNDAKKHGETVIYIKGREEYVNSNNKEELWYLKVTPEYMDVKTKAYYVTVKVNELLFYMDLKNGHIVRLVDGESEEKKVGVLSISELISVFNKRQNAYYNSISNDIKRNQTKLVTLFYLRDFGGRQRAKYNVYINKDKEVILPNDWLGYNEKEYKNKIMGVKKEV